MPGRRAFFVVAAALVAAGLAVPAAQLTRGPERFAMRVVTQGLDAPWEVTWGPDGQLWVTERRGRRVLRVNPADGAQSVALVLPEDPPALVCERTRLYQLFSNLVGNALDHMGDAPDARIEVAIDEEPHHHVISVRDNGRGIAPEHCERIFEVFQSLGPRRDGSRGTGMGLAIVRKIAETQGGQAWVESEPGRGACFKVRLPAA